VNVNGTLKVLLAAQRNKVKRVIFSSSSSTYGDQTEFPLKEDSVIKKPISPYALHKLTGEHYCRLFSELYGVETVSLIYFNVYGPYLDPNGAYALVMGIFLRQKKAAEPLTICGDGEYYRDYTHVFDIVRANILAMQSKTVGKGETINIGNGHPYTVNELAKMMGGPTINIPPRAGDMRYTKADNRKAKELLGWEPTIKFPDGVSAMKKEWNLE
jgi:nucleoside-diphosphate-sugar epimerase